MPPDDLIDLVVRALLLGLALSLPALAGAAAGGALGALLTRAMGERQPALEAVLRLTGVAAALAIAGPWIGAQVFSFAQATLLRLPPGVPPVGLP